MAELTARLRLVADIRNFSQNLQRAAQQGRTSLRSLNQRIGNVGKGLNNATKASKGFFQTLRANVATQIKAGIMFATLYQALITFRQTIGAAISELLKLDTALRKVQSITKDTDVAIGDLGKTLLKAAREGKLFGNTAGEVATGMFEIVQAGFNVADSYRIALTAAKAATTGFTDSATAGKVITGVMLAYGLSVEKVDFVANLLFQTVDTGVITFEQLANGLGTTLAPAAALGVSLDEVLGAVATMTRKGVPAARAFTAITRMLFGFLDPSESARQHAEDLGFALNADTIETHGFVGAMELLNEATDNDSELLADLFDRQRALIGAFTLLSDGGEEWTAVQLEMAKAQDGLGALEDAWIERQKALDIRLQILRAQVLSLVVSALIPLAKQLTVVIGWLSAMIADDMGMFAWIKKMSAITGLTEAWKDFAEAVREMLSGGQGDRLSLMFHGMFVILREGIPMMFSFVSILLRLGAWAITHKPVLIAIALAFGLMFISAHPLLAVFQALFILVGYMDKNWGDWRVKVVGTTAAVLLVVSALIQLRDAFMLTKTAMFLFQGVASGIGGSKGIGFIEAAVINLSRAVAETRLRVIGFFNRMRIAANKAADQVGRVVKGLSDILAKPVNIVRTITVKTIEKAAAGKAAGAGIEGVKKGLISGLIPGITKGLSTGIGAGIVAGILLGLKLALVGVSVAAIGIAAAIVIVIVTVIIAGFLIYKYRKEIWAGLKTMGRVLKEFFTQKIPEMMQPFIDGMQTFFTETLPNWARSQFTPENMGRWFGRILMVAILPWIWPFLLISKFHDRLYEFIGSVAGFLAELPGQLASKIGDAAGAILGAIVDIPKWSMEFQLRVHKFEAKILTFVAEIPGRIAEFIGDHWKDVLNVLVDAAKWAGHLFVKVDEFLAMIVNYVAGIPTEIGEMIGDNWKDIIGFLVDPTAWWELFKTLVQEFVDLVTEKIAPMLSGIGDAIVGGIKSGITNAFSGLGGWIVNAIKGALGPVLGWLQAGAGIFGKFFGGVPGGMQDIIDWMSPGGGEGSGGHGHLTPHGLLGISTGASGIRNFMGGLALVGEQGAELVRLPRGADVVRNADMGQALRGSAGGVSVSAEVNITTSMMREYEDLKKRVLQEVEEKLDDAAGIAGLSKPRLGTLGSGIPRT